ncbi:transketolase [Levilactobacillus brevis]|nr:transketolase [Levilactobacillus brevis]
MLYSLLHLSGFALSRDDLMNFRQLGSKTPVIPEYGVTPGVDATTGPLGQGIGMAVGMAMAEQHLRASYNRPNLSVVDHYTYALCGDGDLMEGVAAEAASLAGQLQLNKLIVLYDSNDVSLDGPLSNACHDNVGRTI